MGSAIPKQFIPIGGKEVLVHTLGKFLAAIPGIEIVVVLPEEYMELWNTIVQKHGLQGTHKVCIGADNRFGSVKNGLAALVGCDVIAIHDGVRPLLSESLIKRCVETALSGGTAIPVVGPSDSYRLMADDYPERIDRALLRAVQTPQVFRSEIIRNAYEAEYSTEFTDDASVVEHSGIRLSFCEGEHINIKITHPEDLLFAEAVIAAGI